MLPTKFGLIGQAVSEIFEYYGNIHVYCPGARADQPLGSKVYFRFIYLQSICPFSANFPFKCFFYNFPPDDTTARATYVDLAVK